MPAPHILNLHHVSIMADDLDVATGFYSQTLGLAPLPLPDASLIGKIAWFDLGNGRALHVIKGKAAPDGLSHFALHIGSVQDWRAHLDALSIAYTAADVDLPGKGRIFTKDPFGNAIELTE